MKTDIFQSSGHCWVFQICWHIECSTFTASSFRIWNSSTGIPSPPLALFVVMLSKAHLTSHSRMSGSRSVITPSWLSGTWRTFLYSSVYSCHLFLIEAQPEMKDLEILGSLVSEQDTVSMRWVEGSRKMSILTMAEIRGETKMILLRTWRWVWCFFDRSSKICKLCNSWLISFHPPTSPNCPELLLKIVTYVSAYMEEQFKKYC